MSDFLRQTFFYLNRGNIYLCSQPLDFDRPKGSSIKKILDPYYSIDYISTIGQKITMHLWPTRQHSFSESYVTKILSTLPRIAAASLLLNGFQTLYSSFPVSSSVAIRFSPYTDSPKTIFLVHRASSLPREMNTPKKID